MTNANEQIQAAAPALQSTFNAWHIVALGVGMALIHGYHVIVQAGGIKNLWRAFWNGPQNKP